MNGPGDQLFARSRLAGDEDSGHRGSDALHDGEDLLHARAASDDVGEGESFFQRAAKVDVLVFQLFPLHRLADDDL